MAASTTDGFLGAHRFYEKNSFCKIARTDLPESFPPRGSRYKILCDRTILTRANASETGKNLNACHHSHTCASSFYEIIPMLRNRPCVGSIVDRHRPYPKARARLPKRSRIKCCSSLPSLPRCVAMCVLHLCMFYSNT